MNSAGALLSNLGGRLGKLIALLASDREGEVLAAVAAIRRVLEGAGLDFNDLAQALGAGLVLGDLRPAAAQRAGVEPDRWRRMADRLLNEAAADLNETEFSFVQAMAGWRGQPSDKQMAWLLRLYRAHLEEVRV